MVNKEQKQQKCQLYPIIIIYASGWLIRECFCEQTCRWDECKVNYSGVQMQVSPPRLHCTYIFSIDQYFIKFLSYVSTVLTDFSLEEDLNRQQASSGIFYLNIYPLDPFLRRLVNTII